VTQSFLLNGLQNEGPVTTNSRVSDGHGSVWTQRYQLRHLGLPVDSRHGRSMVALRSRLLKTYMTGSCLDFGSGAGAYSRVPLSGGSVTSLTAVDRESLLLKASYESLMDLGNEGHIRRVCADGRQLPFRSNSFDSAFAFSSLYYMDPVDRAVRELGRVLRPRGVAVLDLVSSRSLGRLSTESFARAGWAQTITMSPVAIAEMLELCDLEVLECTRLQVLPGQGTPRRYWWLAPLMTPHLLPLLATRIRDHTLDEVLGAVPLLTRYAFRLIYVVRKLP